MKHALLLLALAVPVSLAVAGGPAGCSDDAADGPLRLFLRAAAGETPHLSPIEPGPY